MSVFQRTWSVNKVEQTHQQQAADRSDGGQQRDEGAGIEGKIGHEDFLKGRNHSVLDREACLTLYWFARLHMRQRTCRVPSTGWYSSPVSSSNTIAGNPVSNMVCRASFR